MKLETLKKLDLWVIAGLVYLIPLIAIHEYFHYLTCLVMKGVSRINWFSFPPYTICKLPTIEYRFIWENINNIWDYPITPLLVVIFLISFFLVFIIKIKE
jgi:hypothetical protein